MNSVASSTPAWRPARAADGRPPRSRSAARLDQVSRWVGLVLLAGIWLFPIAATGLLAPLWGVVVAHILWLGHAILAWRIAPSRPRLVPLIPVLALMVWWSWVTFGGLVFGWTA